MTGDTPSLRRAAIALPGRLHVVFGGLGSGSMRSRAHRLWGRGAAFLDQGCLGLANLMINVVLARHLPVVDFAAIGLMIGLHFFVFSIHRGMIVLPFILEDSGTPDTARGSERAEWQTANSCFIALACLGLLLVAALAGFAAQVDVRLDWVAQATSYLVFASPPMLAYEFGRRVLYQEGRHRWVATLSGAYLAAGTSVAVLAAAMGSPLLGGGAFAAAGAAGACAFAVLNTTRHAPVSAAWRRWRVHAGFAGWQSATSILSNLYTASAVVLFGAFAGPMAAAIYAAGRTLVSPMISVTSAVDSTDKPRAARAFASGGMEALHRSIRRTRLTLIGLTLPYFCVVMIFTPWILGALLGAGYDHHTTVVRIIAVSFLLMCMSQPSETRLVVLRASRALFAIRCVAALGAVSGLYVGARFAGITGAVTAFAIVQFLVLAMLLARERILRSRDRKRDLIRFPCD